VATFKIVLNVNNSFTNILLPEFRLLVVLLQNK